MGSALSRHQNDLRPSIIRTLGLLEPIKYIFVCDSHCILERHSVVVSSRELYQAEGADILLSKKASAIHLSTMQNYNTLTPMDTGTSRYSLLASIWGFFIMYDLVPEMKITTYIMEEDHSRKQCGQEHGTEYTLKLNSKGLYSGLYNP